MDILDRIKEIAGLVNSKLDSFLSVDNVMDIAYSSRLLDAMRYGTLSDGKRLRAFLLVSIADIFYVSRAKSVTVAAAIEMIHSYSLIHDDLPAMDDDDYRRGIESCHKKFDEATAILAGDSLLTFAFQVLSDDFMSTDSYTKIKITNFIAKSIGFMGMAGGQMLDMEHKTDHLGHNEILRIHNMKTGKLFIAACAIGGILGNANKVDMDHLSYYAHDIGLAYQIYDDLVDSKNSENSIIASLGYEEAKSHAVMLCNQAKTHLNHFCLGSCNLSLFCDYLLSMINDAHALQK